MGPMVPGVELPNTEPRRRERAALCLGEGDVAALERDSVVAVDVGDTAERDRSGVQPELGTRGVHVLQRLSLHLHVGRDARELVDRDSGPAERVLRAPALDQITSSQPKAGQELDRSIKVRGRVER